MTAGMKVTGEEDQLRKPRAGEIQVAVTIGIEMTADGRERIAEIWEKDGMTETAGDLLSDQSVKKVDYVYSCWTTAELWLLGNLGF